MELARANENRVDGSRTPNSSARTANLPGTKSTRRSDDSVEPRDGVVLQGRRHPLAACRIGSNNLLHRNRVLRGQDLPRSANEDLPCPDLLRLWPGPRSPGEQFS